MLLNAPSHSPPDPRTVRDAGFRARIQQKLEALQQIRDQHNYLAYATHTHLFAELEQVYTENQQAYQQYYAAHRERLHQLESKLEQTEQPIHPLRLQSAQALVRQIEAQLSPEDYLQNQAAAPLLDQLEKQLQEARHEYATWEKALAEWRMTLKGLMHHVWAEDYLELKTDYQQQKAHLQTDVLPRSPLAPIPWQLETAQASRTKEEEQLQQRLRFHPRLKKQAKALQNRYLALNQFQKEALQLRRKAFRRRGIGIVILSVLSLLVVAASWYVPRWIQARNEAAAWEVALEAQSLTGYNQYLEKFPEGAHATEALQAKLAIPAGKLTGLVNPDSKRFDYEGALNQALPHGKGVAVYADTGRYEGQWQQGNRGGQGVMIYANGDQYKGNWSQDQPDGQGTMQFANGDQYTGNWQAGKFQGWGAYQSQTGDTYRGGWQEGQRQGKGIFTYADGSSYEGYWKEGQYHGSGKHISAIGTTYTGNWNLGKRQGEGQLTWANGARFSGLWQADTLNGPGVFVSRFRDQLSGTWKGSPEKVSLYDGAGHLIQQGRWEDGLFLAE